MIKKIMEEGMKCPNKKVMLALGSSISSWKVMLALGGLVSEQYEITYGSSSRRPLMLSFVFQPTGSPKG